MTVAPKLLPLRIRLPYATEEEFTEKYGSNVARGGVFIATRALKPEGTALAFEFVLADGTRLMRGEGVVVKAQIDEGGGRSGMTVRFVKLDAPSKAVIDRLVARRSGEPAPPAATPAPPPAPHAPVTPPNAPGFRSTAPPPGLVRRTSPSPASRPPAAHSPQAPTPPAPEAVAPPAVQPAPSQRAPPAEPAEPAAPEVPSPPPPSPSPSPEVAPAESPATPPPEEPHRAPESKGRRRTVLEVPLAAPVAPSAPEVVLGIDLGTTQARVAVFHEGAARLIPTAGAESHGIPSVLAVNDAGQLLVGAEALAVAERAPRHAAMGLKRLLGLRARSPRLRGFIGLPFSVAPDERGEASVELHGQLIPLANFATHLLRELKSAASSFLGHEATRAVLCVPAHFDARQRAALREAAEHAGLQVQRILNAPAAATLAYGYGRGLARKRVLVMDLGGGSFEVSVVQVTGDDLEIVTTGCEPALGGMEFDARIAEALASELREPGASPPEPPLDWSALRSAAEAAKVVLSEREEAELPLRGGARVSLNRERVEALTADLAQRVTEVTREVLESSALTPQGLDAVVLVGGQSRAPLVRRRLEESLGVTVRSDVEPIGAVALGAALLGRSLLEIESGKPGATVSDVLSVPLGVAERGGSVRRVFERNTRLPADKTLVLPVTPGPLSLALFQGPSPLAAEDEYLGALHFQIERAGEAEIHFSLSQDGTLSLAATLPGTKRQPVVLAAAELDDEARDALIARSPFAAEAEARPSGLLSGLRKLFSKR